MNTSCVIYIILISTIIYHHSPLVRTQSDHGSQNNSKLYIPQYIVAEKWTKYWLVKDKIIASKAQKNG